ncbi:MAG: hypothetical protein AB7O68_22125 [Pirellulales bacterium]
MFCALTIIAVGAARRAEVPREIRAERFVIVNPSGEARGSFNYFDEEDSASLAIRDTHGTPRVILGATENGAHVSVYGPDCRRPRAVVMSAKKAIARIATVDKSGEVSRQWP